MLTSKMIGQKIADARKKTTISQAQLAQLLFISSQAVGKWERGESMPDIVTLNRLAEILGVDLNYFSENFPSSTTKNEQLAIENTENQSVERQVDQTPTTIKSNKLRWDLSNGNWVDADFSGLKNLREKFSSSNMQRCLFIDSELSGLLLKNNNIDRCDFSKSLINNSQIVGSNLVNNLFQNCSLIETAFSGSHIMGCDFSNADLTGVTFNAGGFQRNSIINTVWNHTSFNGMYIAELVFEGTLTDCSFENCKFSKVTFQQATLTNTFFKGNNLKRIRMIDCKVDPLTYAFLKNGKADLSGVTLVTE